MALLSPVLAVVLTLITGAIIFALRGIDPLHGLYVYFIEPLTPLWSLEQLVVKATPLVLIGVGLAVCYTANVWNIGAEGQLTRRHPGRHDPGAVPAWQSPLTLCHAAARRHRRHGLCRDPGLSQERGSTPTRS